MGHELDSDVTPVDVGLQGFTRKTGGFIGYEALMQKAKQPSSEQVVSIKFDDEFALPLGHEPIIHNSNIIGKTTSCAFGYRVNRPIALAQVSTILQPGVQIEVDIAGKYYTATVSVKPLFDAEGVTQQL